VDLKLGLDQSPSGFQPRLRPDNPDTIYSDNGFLKVGTGSSAFSPKDIAAIFPDDTALFGPDAVPDGSTIDSARLHLYTDNTYPTPNDFIAAGEILPPAVFVSGQFPTWDSAAPGADWTSGVWSSADVVERDSDYVNVVNAWYTWSVGAMIQRWLDSASTRHGLALWETGQFLNRASAWIDRTEFGCGSRAGSLLVWFTPPQIRLARRAWIDSPAPLK
jgi:hypothetical protein